MKINLKTEICELLCLIHNELEIVHMKIIRYRNYGTCEKALYS